MFSLEARGSTESGTCPTGSPNVSLAAKQVIYVADRAAVRPYTCVTYPRASIEHGPLGRLCGGLCAVVSGTPSRGCDVDKKRGCAG